MALLLWMQGRGSDYMKVRQGAEEVARLPFSFRAEIYGYDSGFLRVGTKGCICERGARNRFGTLPGGIGKSKLPGIMPG